MAVTPTPINNVSQTSVRNTHLLQRLPKFYQTFLQCQLNYRRPISKAYLFGKRKVKAV